jgi:hypothetical protein
MANWEKLNTELDSILDSMSPVDWTEWSSNRESKKRMRQYELFLKRKMKEESLFLSEIKGSQIISVSLKDIFKSISVITLNENPTTSSDNTSYALAA